MTGPEDRRGGWRSDAMLREHDVGRRTSRGPSQPAKRCEGTVRTTVLISTVFGGTTARG